MDLRKSGELQWGRIGQAHRDSGCRDVHEYAEQVVEAGYVALTARPGLTRAAVPRRATRKREA